MKRIVLVTGAGRGLGFCIVKKHLSLGDEVYAYDFQLTPELEALGAQNPMLHIAFCDISNEESVRQAAGPLLARQQKLDIVYNVAGIFKEEGRVGLAKTDLDLCTLQIDINALGALRVCKTVDSLLGEGTLVMNVTSEAGSVGASRRDGEYGYCMSKAAENMFAKILSNELWPRGGRVMCVHPGWMRTQMGGAGAKNSHRGVEPEQSAEDIIGLALNIGSIPPAQMYMTHTGDIIPW